MKRFILTLGLLVSSIMLMTSVAFAGTAYNASFTTSITYQNVGDATANILFTFYPENNGTGIPVSRTLAKDAGGSLFIGSLDEIGAGFNGSAILSADQPIVATLVQISSDSDVKNRPLSNGFESGSDSVLLATVLKNQFNTTSRFSVQNAHSTAVDVTVEIFNADSPAAAPLVVTHSNLPVGASKVFDMGTLSQVSASKFNGSATITAKEAGGTAAANIVATVLELSTNGSAVSSFEGVNGGSSTVYMASALCERFGATSAYAVQNTAASGTASVEVTYSNGVKDTASIAAGAKKSFNGCSKLSAGFSGSATITSTGGDIVVIGKVFGSGNSTAFLGESEGAEKLALPYVRFAPDSQFNSGARQRAYIAIQNVGASLPSGSVTAKYLDRNGEVVGTHTFGAIGAGQKVNTFATNSAVQLASGAVQSDLDNFGYVGGFGGSVIVEGPDGSELVAVVRIQSKVGSGVVGEDYNGIAVSAP